MKIFSNGNSVPDSKVLELATLAEECATELTDIKDENKILVERIRSRDRKIEELEANIRRLKMAGRIGAISSRKQEFKGAQ